MIRRSATLVAATWLCAAAAPPCPPTLSVTETAPAVAGFTLYADGNPARPAATATLHAALARVMFSEGPPEQSAWLAPDPADARSQTWDFRAGHDRDVWMSCAYAGAMLLLSRPLAAGISACRQTRSQHALVPTISCR